MELTQSFTGTQKTDKVLLNFANDRTIDVKMGSGYDDLYLMEHNSSHVNVIFESSASENGIDEIYGFNAANDTINVSSFVNGAKSFGTASSESTFNASNYNALKVENTNILTERMFSLDNTAAIQLTSNQKLLAFTETESYTNLYYVTVGESDDTIDVQKVGILDDVTLSESNFVTV